MGGLMGLPCYSKIEAVWLSLGVVGAFVSWKGDQCSMVILISTFVCVGTYFGTCLIYAYYARQPLAPFIMLSVLPLVIA